MLKAGLLLACLFFAACAEPARAQESGDWQDQDAEDIRQSTRQLLEAPEFERLRRLLQSESDGKEGGDELVGEGSGSGDGDGDGSGREKKRRGDSDESGDSADGLSMPSFPGVAAAIGSLYMALVWICLAVIVILMLYLVARAIRARRETSKTEELAANPKLRGESEPERAPGELPSDAYLDAARKLAAEGRYREAVAQLLLGAMSHIERAGWIRFRRGLTHRDYLRAIRSRESTYLALRDIVGTYEPLGFGRRTATGEHFILSLRRYEDGFRVSAETA